MLDILLGLYNDEERKIIDGKSEFSGGERQKIALVRLFIKTADVLFVLDDDNCGFRLHSLFSNLVI